jgi:hypothetical protein
MADDTSEVTAQRMTAAFNAVQDVASFIVEHRSALELTPIGRRWLSQAEQMRQLAGGSDSRSRQASM